MPGLKPLGLPVLYPGASRYLTRSMSRSLNSLALLFAAARAPLVIRATCVLWDADNTLEPINFSALNRFRLKAG
jgi:hypothetical protein